MATQSTFGYVRNEIVRPATAGAPRHWSAIVEEAFPIQALDDPRVFFDVETDAEATARLEAMLASCRRFIDLASIEVTFTSEYPMG